MKTIENLRILFVEDRLSDLELAERELHKGGLVFISKVVEDKDAFKSALLDFSPHIVVSDYNMPQFDGMQALFLTLEHDPFLPFIVVTGSANEDTAVKCLKSGASDYLIKGHIARLPFAIREALDNNAAKREREHALEALKRSEEQYRSLFEGTHAILLVLDPETLKILDVNEAACRFYGWSKTEFESKSLQEINPLPLGDIRKIVGSTVQKTQDTFYVPHRLASGEIRQMEVFSSPIPYKGRVVLFSIIHDITSRVLAEESTHRLLQEKEGLLRELYHRTRNSMQVISSILTLQADFSHDEKIKTALVDTSNRVHSMSLVHQKLYQARNLSWIDLRDYVDDLVSHQTEAFQTPQIEFDLEVEPIQILIDTAVPCGLVINELISNARRHAFPGKKRGTISLKIRKEGGLIVLDFWDDGVGVPQGFVFPGGETLGMQLIQSLIEHQLHGTTAFEVRGGLHWHFEFQHDVLDVRISS